LVVSVAGGCAGKGTSDETREVYVVSVPHGAAVSLEGRAVGRTPVSVALPAAGRHPGPLAVRLERTGFRPEVRSFRGDAAPDRLVVVLRPDLASAPAVAPAPDDAEGLYRMAGLLVDARRCRDALEYLDRTLELAPRHALAHRERGECLLDLGEPALAIEHLSRYLLLVPDAPDAAQVQAQLDGLRGAKTVERGTSASDE
jgi:hypothetical protein